MILPLLLTYIILSFQLVGAVEHAGTEFILAFCEHVIQKSVPVLTLTNNNDEPADVNISTPGSPVLHHYIKMRLMDTISYRFTKNAIQIRTSRNTLAFLVTSSKTITVQGYNTYRMSIGGFLALPVSELGTKYLILTHCQTHVCIIMIVATAMKSHVSVNFKMKRYGRVKYYNKVYKSGDTLDLDLEKYDTVQLQCHKDMSGTLVTSTKPVSLFAGSDSTRVSIGNKKVKKDNIIEQLPPTPALGCLYAIPMFPNISCIYLIKIISLEDNTVLKVDHKTIVLRRRKPYLLQMDGRLTHVIISSAPILVVVLTDSRRDGSMSVLYPVNLTKSFLNLGKTFRIRNSLPLGKTRIKAMYFLIVYEVYPGKTPIAKTSIRKYVTVTPNVTDESFKAFPIYSITMWMRGHRTAAMLPWPTTMLPHKVDVQGNRFCYEADKWIHMFLKHNPPKRQVYNHLRSFISECCL